MAKPNAKKKPATKISIDETLTTAEIAMLWKVPEAWFIRARTLGAGPPFSVIPPGIIRYNREGARLWLAKRVHQKTSDHLGKSGGPRMGRPLKRDYLAIAAEAVEV
jgi:hypothetical protein